MCSNRRTAGSWTAWRTCSRASGAIIPDIIDFKGGGFLGGTAVPYVAPVVHCHACLRCAAGSCCKRMH